MGGNPEKDDCCHYWPYAKGGEIVVPLDGKEMVVKKFYYYKDGSFTIRQSFYLEVPGEPKKLV